MTTPEENHFKQPVSRLHQTPCTWMYVSTVQYRTLSATSVATLDTGSQGAEEGPSPQTEWENTTP